jgi:hypothetical protein
MLTTLLAFISIAAAIAAGINLLQLKTLRQRFDQALGNNTGQPLEKTLSKYNLAVADVSQRYRAQRPLRRSSHHERVACQKFPSCVTTAGGDGAIRPGGTRCTIQAMLTSIHGRQGGCTSSLEFGKKAFVVDEEQQTCRLSLASQLPPVNQPQSGGKIIAQISR